MNAGHPLNTYPRRPKLLPETPMTFCTRLITALTGLPVNVCLESMTIYLHSPARRCYAFTLIELLIVVGIIAVLAAIAVPNMLEAQVRAKVSRTQSDMRTLATALETYRVDHNNYPPENYPSPLLVTLAGQQHLPNALRLRPVTTPIAYLSELPTDVFAPASDPLNQATPRTFHYVSINDPLYPTSSFFRGNNPEKIRMQWMVQSCGPDRGSDGPESSTYWQFPRYDPTNGTISLGNILRSGP